MAVKSQPWMQVNCYPLTPQQRWTAKAFGVSDNLANLDRGPEPDGAAYSGMGGASTGDVTPSTGPGQGGHIAEVDGLKWTEFWDEDDMTRLAGYRVAPRHTPLQSILQDDDKLNPPENGIGLVWVPSGNTTDYWSTVLPDREPLHTGVKFGSVNMGHLAAANTALPLPEDQEFRLELQCLGVARTDVDDLQPWVRITWGNRYALYLVAGQVPALNDVRASGDHGEHTGDNATKLRDVGWASAFWQYSPMAFGVDYIGGRMALAGDAGTTIYTNRKRNTNPRKQREHDKEGSVEHVTAKEAPLQIESRGVAFELRVQETAYADTEFETGEADQPDYARSTTDTNTGLFKRKFFTAQAPGAAGVAGYVRGYFPRKMASTGVEQSPELVASVAVDANTSSGEQYYQCDLEADTPDAELETASWRDDVRCYKGNAMRGHASPFVHGVVVRSGVTWRAQTNLDPVDVRPAVTAASESSADPALQAGPTWDFTLDRNVLHDIDHPVAGTLGDDWDAYVGKYHELHVSTAWIYDDGVQRAYAEAGGTAVESIARLWGYTMSVGPEAPGINERYLRMTARDPIVRLQQPAGLIDSKYAALDFLMAHKMATSSPDYKSKLYGADCAQYIISTALDEWAGGVLQVYYPGYTGTWPPPDGTSPNQWTLMDYKLFTDPPSGGGMIWPPPFGQAAHDWIRQLCQADFAVFFIGRSIADPTLLAPCYGNYFSYVNGAITTRIPDARYLTGDENFVASAADYRDVPEEDYNRFVVWGQAPGGGDLGGLMPALPEFSAQYTIEDSDIEEQNARLTWERSKVLKGTHFYLPSVARQVARLDAWLVRSLNVRSTSVKCRGNEWLGWGQKAQLAATGTESDPALDIREPDGSLATFRIMRVRNNWRFGNTATWETHLSLAPQPVDNPYD